MKTLDNIKDEYAKENHYNDWDSLLNKQESLANIEWHYNNIIEIAQKECLKRASENAKLIFDHKNTVDYGYLEESITNENNLVK